MPFGEYGCKDFVIPETGRFCSRGQCFGSCTWSPVVLLLLLLLRDHQPNPIRAMWYCENPGRAKGTVQESTEGQ
jgi:hypothetical protein